MSGIRPKTTRSNALAALLAALIAGQAAGNTPSNVDASRLLKADQNNSEWLNYGRTYDEQRYSPLKKINQDNIGKLGLAWYFDLDTSRGQEATPIVVDGTMYVTSAWSKVFALDARTGKEKWRFDPKVAGAKAVDACCDVVNRGVAVWGNKVFVGALDGRLIALDMTSGKPAWSVQTTNPKLRYTITGAPRVINGKVIIGNGGGEMGVRGFVTAYDAGTGKQLWRFYTVPGNPSEPFESKAMEMAAKTWAGQWWKYGGGGTVWDAMAYDAELGLLYIGVGNGSPWNHQIRSAGKGDNLFLSSIVALKADTGEYVWHFQSTPAETWDYTATQHIMLADLTIDGVKRKVLMQAPKNGFFYVIDRVNGKFIQAKNYVTVTWTTGLDPQTGRPKPVPEARYVGLPAVVAPSTVGAHNWYPMSFNPQTGLVYFPILESKSRFEHDPKFQFRELSWNTGIARSGAQPNAKTVAATAKIQGSSALLAWDPVKQREAWRVKYERSGNGGTLSTAANLVFEGTIDGYFRAYDAQSGKPLWSYNTQNAVLGGPATFELDGEQYIATLAGIGGVVMSGGPAGSSASFSEFGRVVAFKIGGTARLPQIGQRSALTTPDLSRANATGDAALGARHYEQYCAVCHGRGVRSGTGVPDLRYSATIASRNEFKAIVLDGTRAAKGMVGFAATLKPEDAEALRAHLIEQSKAVAADAMR